MGLEHAKATADGAAPAVTVLALNPLFGPSEAYKHAEATGRCKLVCFDKGGGTLACATIDGRRGGGNGSREAVRTDDIITIVHVQFGKMAPGPKLICGDLNAMRDALPTLQQMINEEGWTDIGNDARLCGGKPRQNTCHENGGAKAGRAVT